MRKKVMAAITQRQGQPQFRKSLLEAYAGRCVLTDCDAECALEAAHILPYAGPDMVDSRPYHGAGLLLKKQHGGLGATSTRHIQFLEANYAEG